MAKQDMTLVNAFLKIFSEIVKNKWLDRSQKSLQQMAPSLC
jgi:hypothetical protein